MSWHEALLELEDTTSRLAALGTEDLDAVAGILESRAAAISNLRTPPAIATESDGQRLRAALEGGEAVMEKLRVKQAATRSALARVNGESYLLRRLGGSERAQVHFDLTA